jgi:hypothetical protein
MSARILQFPPRAPFDVLIRPEASGGWLVTVRNGRHGWLYGDHHSAVRSAVWLAQHFSTRIREIDR